MEGAAAKGAIVPAAADKEDEAVTGAPEAAVDDEPAPPADCGGSCCISDSSRTESLSKLILTCDQRCVDC